MTKTNTPTPDDLTQRVKELEEMAYNIEVGHHYGRLFLAGALRTYADLLRELAEDRKLIDWYFTQDGTAHQVATGGWVWCIPEHRGIPVITTLGEFETFRDCIRAAAHAALTPQEEPIDG